MDLSFLSEISNPFSGMVFLFRNGAWVAFAALGLWMTKEMWLAWRQSIFEKKIEYVLLAVDVPKDNEQTPKAVEQFFDHLTGFDKNPTFQEAYWEGFVPTRVSLELVSIGGYVQFLIRTPVKFRDLVEAALYAEYPDAELTEVEDYVNNVPKPDDFVKYWPDKMDWNLWGSEISLYKPDPYPIRTWIEFEHNLSRELKDPMASILEMLSRLDPDEQVWIQWVIQTAPYTELPTKAAKLIKKLIGSSDSKSKGGGLLDIPRNVVQGVTESFTASVIEPTEFATSQSQETNKMQNRLLYMTPGEVGVVMAIERKAQKAAFKVRGRLMYFGKKHVFSKAKGVSGVYGTIKQFNTAHLNGFSPPPKSKTEAWYFFPKYRTRQRMRSLLAGYRSRSNWAGHKASILNTEELATIWHFPGILVKAQFVQKTTSKKSSPPSALPFKRTQDTGDIREQVIQEQRELQQSKKAQDTPPENLPFV